MIHLDRSPTSGFRPQEIKPQAIIENHKPRIFSEKSSIKPPEGINFQVILIESTLLPERPLIYDFSLSKTK